MEAQPGEGEDLRKGRLHHTAGRHPLRGFSGPFLGLAGRARSDCSSSHSSPRTCSQAQKVCEHGLTWIKPSFTWMMYRCGWGAKPGQETVLAVEITRDGFEWALRNACLSSYVRGLHPDRSTWQRQLKRAPTRVQWDPERDLHLRPLPYRSLQLGLSGEAARRYADEWTVSLSDVTPLAREIHALVSSGDLDSAARLLPEERPYPAGDELLAHLREPVRPHTRL
ncbi:DUF4291 domain-containing protein [Streptomyces sp. NPDC052043]|uniref:DUF4291 domain-containing protein n=1 Tax=Streptomyces sp. NPDC052043 TaxID=3365684 RepID=UPI0037D42DBB